MDCNCRSCLKWLNSEPGPWCSIITWGVCVAALVAACLWGW